MDLHLFVGWQGGHCDHPWVDKLGWELERKGKKKERSDLMGFACCVQDSAIYPEVSR